MENSQIKNTGHLVLIVVLVVLLSFMLFSFGMELGREYYSHVNPK